MSCPCWAKDSRRGLRVKRAHPLGFAYSSFGVAGIMFVLCLFLLTMLIHLHGAHTYDLFCRGLPSKTIASSTGNEYLGITKSSLRPWPGFPWRTEPHLGIEQQPGRVSGAAKCVRSSRRGFGCTGCPGDCFPFRQFSPFAPNGAQYQF